MRLMRLMLAFSLSGFLAFGQPFLLGRRQATRTGLPANCESVNDSNLKTWWKMEEATGNSADAKGTNVLIDNNGVTGTASGRINNARSFNAAFAQFFSAPDGPDISGGNRDFMFGGWFIFGGILAGAPVLISKYTAAGNQREYYLWESSALERYVCSYSSNGTVAAEVDLVADSAGDPADSVWHFVVSWHDSVADTINIQVDNGTVDSVSYGTGVYDGTGDFQIGAVNSVQTWIGNIDEVFFTTRILTAHERTQLYNSGLACRPTTIP